LRIIEICGVDHEEFCQPAGLRQLVIALAAHIEERVLALVLPSFHDIVIPKHRIETDAVSDKPGKGLLEVLHKVTSTAIGINVVAGRDYKIEWTPLVTFQHLSGNSNGIAISGTPVTDDRKSDFVLDRPDSENRRRLNQSAGGKCCKGLNGVSSRNSTHVSVHSETTAGVDSQCHRILQSHALCWGVLLIVDAPPDTLTRINNPLILR
jgi:hypothetical protein